MDPRPDLEFHFTICLVEWGTQSPVESMVYVGAREIKEPEFGIWKDTLWKDEYNYVFG